MPRRASCASSSLSSPVTDTGSATATDKAAFTSPVSNPVRKWGGLGGRTSRWPHPLSAGRSRSELIRMVPKDRLPASLTVTVVG
jgi:hypothetical protein